MQTKPEEKMFAFYARNYCAFIYFGAMSKTFLLTRIGYRMQIFLPFLELCYVGQGQRQILPELIQWNAYPVKFT